MDQKIFDLNNLKTFQVSGNTGNEPGGMQAYIDRFQAYMAELTAIKPRDYTDDRKKRLLLINVSQASGIAHLVQKCRDNETCHLTNVQHI